MTAIRQVTLIGFGEVGSTLASDLESRSAVRLTAWDIQFIHPASPAARNLLDRPRVKPAAGPHAAVEGAELVISAVTAGEDRKAAAAVAGGLGPGTWFLDLNSVAPGTRRAVADVVARAGGRYVEAAVMSPIGPQRIGSPMLLGGPHASELLPQLQALGFAGARLFSSEIGRASAAKMCRSVIVKGTEALVAEALLAARHYGVEDEVTASLGDLFPGIDWSEMSRYMIARSVQHGRRRAEEMQEVAATVRAAGVQPWMSLATVQRQAWASRYPGALGLDGLVAMLDRLRADMSPANGEAD